MTQVMTQATPIQSLPMALDYCQATTKQFVNDDLRKIPMAGSKLDISFQIFYSSCMFIQRGIGDRSIVDITELRDSGFTSSEELGITATVKNILTALLGHFKATRGRLSQSFIDQLDNLNVKTHTCIKTKEIAGKVERYLIDDSYKILTSTAFNLVTELKEKKYSYADTCHYLKWLIDLCHSQLKPKKPLFEEKVQQLMQDMNLGIKYKKESEKNTVYSIQKNDTTLATFILQNDTFSKFDLEIPSYKPLLCPAMQNKMMAMELASLLGFRAVSPGVGVGVMENGVMRHGFMQLPLPKNSLNDYLAKPGGAELLLTLSTLTAQQLAIISLILGLENGDGENYVFEEVDGKLINGYISDCQAFIPYNKIEPGTIITCTENLRARISTLRDEIQTLTTEQKIICEEKMSEIAALEARIRETEKTIILMQAAILGLPQNNLPIDRATLLILADPIILELVTKYHTRIKNHYQVSPEALQAQIERVTLIQEICQDHILFGEGIPLTSRDIAYRIGGGDFLYALGRTHGYPDAIIFRDVIGDLTHKSLRGYTNLNSIINWSDQIKGKQKASALHENLGKIESAIKKFKEMEIAVQEQKERELVQKRLSQLRINIE